MRTSEVLNKAADLIEEHGWQQGSWGLACDGQPIRPLCAEGAILAAAGLGEAWWDAEHDPASPIVGDDVLNACPAAEAVRDYICTDWISAWNDWPHRTAAEVIEVLRAAALIEQAKESERVTESVSS